MTHERHVQTHTPAEARCGVTAAHPPGFQSHWLRPLAVSEDDGQEGGAPLQAQKSPPCPSRAGGGAPGEVGLARAWLIIYNQL